MEELTENLAGIEKAIDDQLDAVIAAAMQRKLDLRKELQQMVQQKMVKLMQQKRELQDTQRALEECYMVNDTTFDALDRKTKILDEIDDAFQPVVSSQIDVVLAVDEITASISSLGTISTVEPKPRLRGLSVVASPEPTTETTRVVDRDGNTVTLLEQKYIIVAGYIRRVLPHLQAPFVKIPSSVSLTVLDYYHQSIATRCGIGRR